MRDSSGARESAEILKLMLDALPAFVVAGDASLRFTVVRGPVLRKLGLDEAAQNALVGTRIEDFFAGKAGRPIVRAVHKALAGTATSLELPWGGRWYDGHVAPLRDKQGAVTGVLAVGMDVTRRHRLQEQAVRARELLEQAQELAEVGSWVIDIPSGEVEMSAQLTRLLGLPPQLRRTRWNALAHAFSPAELHVIEGEKERALANCGTYDFEHDIVRPDGSVRRVRSRGYVQCDEERNPIRCVGTVHDVTERFEAQRTAEMLAYHDPLTGLPNRWLLQDRLENAIASAAREDRRVYAVFIDLDDFKRINDTLGHAYGDVLLAEVGQRLHGISRSSDTVARVGGDEFVIILTHIEDDERLQAALQKVRSVFARPFRLNDTDYLITASFGVAGYPGDARDESELLRDADAAMYEAKQRGKNAVQRYSGKSVAASAQRVQLEAEVRRAVRNREFEVYYQPIVDAGSLRTIGVEALLRWRHPARGLLEPIEFLHAVEHTEYVMAIGHFVLNQACAQLARWQRDYGLPLRLSVNVSAAELQKNNFPERLRETLKATGLLASSVDIELTENTVVHDLEGMIRVLGRVRELGAGVSIDDFGTGYNSLSYLKHFPITGLKIDRSFVSEMNVDAFDQAISSAVIALGKSLRVRVTAEGVEQREQLQSLVALGCDEIQGFYFAPPLTAADVERRLIRETAAG